VKGYDIYDYITVFPVNWMYNIWKRRLQACTSNSPEQPSYLTGSLQAVASGSQDGVDEGSQYPDTTTAGPQLDVPLSPLEMRQLTNNLGRLYHSCKYNNWCMDRRLEMMSDAPTNAGKHAGSQRYPNNSPLIGPNGMRFDLPKFPPFVRPNII